MYAGHHGVLGKQSPWDALFCGNGRSQRKARRDAFRPNHNKIPIDDNEVKMELTEREIELEGMKIREKISRRQALLFV